MTVEERLFCRYCEYESRESRVTFGDLVYGQKYESPRLTSGSGAGDYVSQKVAKCSVFLRYSHMLTCIHATQQPDLLDMPKFLQSTRVIDMMVCSKQVHCFSTLRLATQYFLQGVNLW